MKKPGQPAVCANQPEALSSVLALPVNELVVKHPGEPRTQVFDARELVPTLIELYQHVLQEILCIGHLARESVCQPVELLEIRLEELLEARSVIGTVGTHLTLVGAGE